jgi:hypothetical protein
MLLGGVLMSVWRGARRPVRVVAGVTLLQGALLVVAGLHTTLPTLTVVAFLYLSGVPVVMASNHALWLRSVPVAVQGSVLGFRRAVEGAALPVAALVAGPLVAVVFEPLATATPALAALVGAGAGRGISLMYAALGVSTVLLAAGMLLAVRGAPAEARADGRADAGAVARADRPALPAAVPEAE